MNEKNAWRRQFKNRYTKENDIKTVMPLACYVTFLEIQVSTDQRNHMLDSIEFKLIMKNTHSTKEKKDEASLTLI